MPAFRNIAAAAFAAVVTFPALADTRMVYVDENSGVEKTVFTISGNRVRVDSAGDESYTIFDNRSDILTLVDTGNRTYTSLDEESVRELSGQVNAAMEKMRRELEKMPPEQREMMEKMMGGMAGAGRKSTETTVDRTGKTLEKGGYTCRQVFVSVGSLSRSEMCVADASDIDMPADDRAALHAMFTQMQVIAREMAASAGMDFSYDLEALGGMPVYTKQDDERSGVLLDSVTHDGIDASVFEVPDGYREEKLQADR